MERKDPKDMTASELLRWAAKNVDSDANYAAQAIEIICDVVGSECTHTYEGSMANALEAVADKIDAANCTLFGEASDSTDGSNDASSCARSTRRASRCSSATRTSTGRA